MDDRDIDRLFAGSHTEDDAALAQLAQVLQVVRDAYPEVSTEACEASHLATMMETAHLLAEKGGPVARPVSNAHGPALRASGLPIFRRTTLNDIWARKSAKVAAIALAAVLALGGTAFAGALPTPVQNVVATAAETVGIPVPHASTLTTFTVPPGYAAAHEVSSTIMGTLGRGPGNSSHEASHTLVPGNNGLHLGWAIGNHFGWTKGVRGQDESGTVEPVENPSNTEGHGPSASNTSKNIVKAKGPHANTTAGPGTSGKGSSGSHGNGNGHGNSDSNGMGNGRH